MHKVKSSPWDQVSKVRVTDQKIWCIFRLKYILQFLYQICKILNFQQLSNIEKVFLIHFISKWKSYVANSNVVQYSRLEFHSILHSGSEDFYTFTNTAQK